MLDQEVEEEDEDEHEDHHERDSLSRTNDIAELQAMETVHSHKSRQLQIEKSKSQPVQYYDFTNYEEELEAQELL